MLALGMLILLVFSYVGITGHEPELISFGLAGLGAITAVGGVVMIKLGFRS